MRVEFQFSAQYLFIISFLTGNFTKKHEKKRQNHLSNDNVRYFVKSIYTYLLTSISRNFCDKLCIVQLPHCTNALLFHRFRAIMYVMAGQTLTMSLIGAICTSLIAFLEIKSFVNCTIYVVSRFFMHAFNFASIAMISQIRYFIANQSANGNTIKWKRIHQMVVLCYFLLILGGCGLLPMLASNGLISPINICIGRASNKERY